MSKVKVLFFAADPLSVDGSHIRLKLDHEGREIRAEMVAALHRDRVEFVPCGATRLGDLRRELLRERPQVVHFSGHGNSQGKGLVLEGEDGLGPHYVGEDALKKFFGAYRDQIKLVVLNACHSRPQAEAIAEAVGCAIGTPDQIDDNAAITFSAAFYSSIAYGQSVQGAFDQACATLKMKGFADHQDPELVVRPGLDASKIILIPPQGPGIPYPVSPPRWGRRTAVAAAVALTCGTAYLGFRPDPACAPARAVKRDVVSASTAAKAQVGLIRSRSAGANDPMAGPQELVQARTLHKAGNHTADFALFREAAENGNVEAMTSLGLAYRDGEGVPAQADSALKWLRAAAGRGDLRGMTELGNAYYNRVGVDRDSDHLAKHWYQKAADEGYAEAMRNLGKLYSEGRGVEPDGATALDWYAKAARAGFVDAMVDAGLMYDDGLAVPKNTRLAMCWYDAAADAGSMRGKGAIGIVDEKNLSKADDRD